MIYNSFHQCGQTNKKNFTNRNSHIFGIFYNFCCALLYCGVQDGLKFDLWMSFANRWKWIMDKIIFFYNGDLTNVVGFFAVVNLSDKVNKN